MTRDDLYDILRYVSHATDSLDLIWGQPFDGETEKITEKITERDTERDTETAEQKLAWLKILLCTKSCDPVFTDYWLRLARRNLRLGLPLTTPEPELNLATGESSATDHFRDATKMVSGESSAPTSTQPQ